MQTKILRDIGLSETEVKLYLALLELGPSTAGPILEVSNLSNSTLHRDLNSLSKKGVISYTLEGRKKTYQASDPENFLTLINEKKREIEEIIPKLKKKQETVSVRENVRVYKGTRGIKEVYNLMINSGADEYLTYGGGPSSEKLMGLGWWLDLHDRRIREGIASKQIFDSEVKKIGGKKIARKKLTNIKYLPAEFAGFQETVIVGDKVAINVFTENPYSFLIEDKNVAEGYRKHFKLLWKQAKE